MKEMRIYRFFDGTKQTLGALFAANFVSLIDKEVFSCSTLELPDKGNEPFISRILAGIYIVKKRYSKKHKWHLEILNVPGRTNILIHALSFYKDTSGCIGVGDRFKDINRDGVLDIINSRKTLDELIKFLDFKRETSINFLTIIDVIKKKTISIDRAEA